MVKQDLKPFVLAPLRFEHSFGELWPLARLAAYVDGLGQRMVFDPVGQPEGVSGLDVARYTLLVTLKRRRQSLFTVGYFRRLEAGDLAGDRFAEYCRSDSEATAGYFARMYGKKDERTKRAMDDEWLLVLGSRGSVQLETRSDTGDRGASLEIHTREGEEVLVLSVFDDDGHEVSIEPLPVEMLRSFLDRAASKSSEE